MKAESIKKFDLVLAGVGFTDIFFDYDYFLRQDFSLSLIKDTLIESLSKDGKNSIYTWCDSSNKTMVDKVLKSKSSYKVMSKREEFVSCKIDDIMLNIENIFDRAPKTSQSFDLDKILNLVSGKINLTDIEIKFFVYGNSIIRGSYHFNDVNLSFSNYSYLSDFLHSAFGEILTPIYEKGIAIYQQSLRQCFKNNNLESLLLVIPNLDSKNTAIKLDPLTFSIRYHFIYSTQLKENFEENLPEFKKILDGEWELYFKDVILNNDASIYLGWSESLFIFDDNSKQEQYLKYSLPLEVVLANWASLKLLTIKIDKAIAFSSNGALTLNKKGKNKLNYQLKMNEIQEFSIKLDRIIEYYSSYTVSNNPTNFMLIDMQSKVFMQDSKINEIKSKMELLSKIIERLSALQKRYDSHRLNTTLLALTFMSIIGNSYTIFNIFKHQPSNEIPIIIGILFGILTIIQLYVIISKKIIYR